VDIIETKGIGEELSVPLNNFKCVLLEVTIPIKAATHMKKISTSMRRQ
jgi:hypothetical protein